MNRVWSSKPVAEMKALRMAVTEDCGVVIAATRETIVGTLVEIKGDYLIVAIDRRSVDPTEAVVERVK